jgi:flagellar biogenesis protein FliO
LAETRRKRAVAVGRAVPAKPGSAEPPSSYALRLEQALEAISAAQAASEPAPTAPAAGARTARAAVAPAAARKASPARRAAKPKAAVATAAAEAPTKSTKRRAAGAAAAASAAAEVPSATSARTTRARRTSAALAYQQAVTDTADAASDSWAVDSWAVDSWAVDALDAEETAHTESAAGAATAAAEDEDDAELEAALSSDSRFAATFDAALAADEPVAKPRGLRAWLAALDRMPPIRLPIGPAIPWKVGLPALVAAVVLMATLNHSTASADAQGVSLPAQETYAVQQSAPLFAGSQQAQAAPTPQPAPVGVQDPTGGFDFFDVGIKLAAVLGLAYGSLVLLKRAGVGGAGSSKSGGNAAGLKVVSSLALAPNRSVHVISVPGGKSLLVAATPNQVNLIADLGEVVATQEAAHDTSFLDVLASKIGK